MNIRPRNIKKYDGGGYFDNLNNDYFNWYNGIWKENARILGNLPLSKRTDRWGKPTGYDIHHQTDDLRGAAWSNYNYTLASNKDNVRNDIQYYLDNSGVNYTSPEDFVSKYNDNIDNIFNTQNKQYNYSMKDTSWTPFNRNYNLTYHSKGAGEGYSTILYDPTSEQYRGTSTHARRPDLYEKDFDKLTDDEKWDRIHKIKLNGKDIYVAKESNGHLRLLPNITTEEDIKQNPATVKDPEKEKEGSLTPQEKADPESLWSKLGAGLKNVAPDLLDTLRLAGNMINNQRVYNESMKAIKPNLQQSYHTYRQVVGDEATKQGYYRRAVQGEQKAAQPFTADADRQVAYMNEAKRIGDELRAQGDLADNQRIRETSAESAAHADANRERDTAVANSNLTEMLKADAAKHQLTAQKYSADWTNLEQYLMGRQYKLEQKKAEQKELEKQLSLLDAQENLLGDTKLRDLKTAYDEAYDAYYNEKDPTKKAALKQKYEKIANDYQLHKIQKSREALKLQYGVYSAKEGTKIEKKRKDDSLKYLYRTSKDIVEHFRKMSKMTDDSRVRTMPKPIKTSSHPRKMQLGGVAPFTIYRPLGVGGETTTQTSTSTEGSKSSKDTAAKDKLDMIKELFKQVQGLPVDVSKVYQEIAMTLNKAKAFGEELTTDDIASMYLNSMNKMAQLKYSAEAYKQAHTQAVANEALNEIAVGSQGELILQDRETGEIKRGTLTQLKESEGKLNALTNSQLLEVRAKSPNLAFNDDIFNIVNNGVGLSKISKEIKAMAASLGSQERKLEGVTEVQNRKIKAGLQTLAGYDGTPDGFYKVTQDSKESKANVSAALNYIYNMLPTNYKVIMKLHSGSEEASKNLIAQYLMSQTSDFYKEDVAPLTGKASDKDGKDSSEKIKSNPLMQLIQGEGGVPRTWNLITKDSNIKMSVDGIEYSQLPKITEDMSLDKMLSESGIAGILDSKQGITFGDQNISPDQLKDVMYSNSGGMVVTLPCKIVNGHKEVNLGVKKTYEEAIQEVESKGISKNSSEYYLILKEKENYMIEQCNQQQ